MQKISISTTWECIVSLLLIIGICPCCLLLSIVSMAAESSQLHRHVKAGNQMSCFPRKSYHRPVMQVDKGDRYASSLCPSLNSTPIPLCFFKSPARGVFISTCNRETGPATCIWGILLHPAVFCNMKTSSLL